MKYVFSASIFHNGVLGGAVYIESDKIIYTTNKLSVELKYRRLEILYNDITEIQTGLSVCFPTVTFIMKNGISYKFIVFRRKKFLSLLAQISNINI